MPFDKFFRRLLGSKSIDTAKFPFERALIVDQFGKTLGQKPLADVLASIDKGKFALRLVSREPPVCRIVDTKLEYGAQKERERAESISRALSKQKEMIFGTAADNRDIEIKTEKVLEWLSRGISVKIALERKGAVASQRSLLQLKELVLKKIGSLGHLVRESAINEHKVVLELRGVRNCADLAFTTPKKKPARPQMLSATPNTKFINNHNIWTAKEFQIQTENIKSNSQYFKISIILLFLAAIAGFSIIAYHKVRKGADKSAVNL